MLEKKTEIALSTMESRLLDDTREASEATYGPTLMSEMEAIAQYRVTRNKSLSGHGRSGFWCMMMVKVLTIGDKSAVST
jgi:hypothetical protein